MPWWYLVVSVWGALFTLNALRPARNQYLMALSFFPAWLTVELAVHHIAWQAAATAVFVWAGALEAWPGWLGLGITLLSWVGLASLARGGRVAATSATEVLAELLPESYDEAIADRLYAAGDRPRWRRLLRPFSARDRRVRVVRDITFARGLGRDLKLDLILPREPGERRPVLLHVHGGAWVLGFKRYQGMPLMTHLAARGWIGVNIDYRLSPMATFPDHLVDVKRAIAWIRQHIAEHGGDPDFVVVTGGSAGGHLTALTGLTANDPALQPGFEAVDTSVRAAVPVYGIYDFTNRLGTMPARWVDDFVAPMVMKTGLSDDPEAYRRASPIDLVHADAPPFLVIHGTRDNLAPVEDAREFVARLRSVSRQPVGYLEVHGATHAFDQFHSGHTRATVDTITRFLLHLHATGGAGEALQAAEPEAAAEGEALDTDEATAGRP